MGGGDAGRHDFFQVTNRFPVTAGILDFASCTLADVAINVDYIDAVCHVDFALVHIIEHLLGALCPDLIVSAMAEETDTDYYISSEGQSLLGFKELVFKASAAAKGDNGVFIDHIISKNSQ